MFKVIFSTHSKKYLDKMNAKMRLHILQALYQYAESGIGTIHIKPLKGEKIWAYRMRVGDYRIIFDRDDLVRVISVLKIWPRGDVYK